MTHPEFKRCAVNVTLAMIGGKWKPVILQHMAPGELRFVQLWRALPRVSKKVLLEQLRQLVADGLVGRTEHLKFPPEVSYHLTPIGHSLIPVLQCIDEWAVRHLPAQRVVTARPGEASPA